MTTEADTTALTYRLPQQRKLVTELPGPRSKEFAARRGRAVAAGSARRCRCTPWTPTAA